MLVFASTRTAGTHRPRHQPLRPHGRGRGVRQEHERVRSPVRRPDHTPNVNLGPIETAPFSAIAVLPTPLGTALGLRTDPSAQVLDEAGAPIPGLYACGNDAQSVMASEYPGAGCQVGAGLTFGYVAARHAAGAA